LLKLVTKTISGDRHALVMKAVIVGGTRTGVGKTTVSLALSKALAAAGFAVQSFKAGPGFVDTRMHEAATGQPCYNLDPFLMGEEGVKRELSKSTADFVVIEGASGMYTGASSAARIADLIGAPIVLTVDASASSESVAATALGFVRYASYTPFSATVIGVVATRVASDKHLEDIRSALKKVGIPLVGVVRKGVWQQNQKRRAAPTKELEISGNTLAAIYKQLDIESISSSASELHFVAPVPSVRSNVGITIGIPLDAAFCSYYRSNLESLEHAANLEYFSPLTDRLPHVDALYLGGGYQENYVQRLSQNVRLLRDIREHAEQGMPIYAEGGSFAYLSRSLETVDGARYKLTGIIPAEVKMTANLQAVGHSEVEVVRDCAIAMKGEGLRGHEYHQCIAAVDDDARFAYRMVRGKGVNGCDGVTENNTLASFQHLHVYGLRDGFDAFLTRVQRYVRS
jgi:cobyrinic acid a,c-diamide synthase